MDKMNFLCLLSTLILVLHAIQIGYGLILVTKLLRTVRAKHSQHLL